MTSKVLVKLPVVPFSQRKKLPAEMISIPNSGGRSDEATDDKNQCPLLSDKIIQLEQNMKFLQDQHQKTLAALHQEVEVLRERNRDLQYQLVFSKNCSCTACSSSPEDAEKGFAKEEVSPGSINVTPLQVELLEKDLQDVKASLNETKARNLLLSETVEKQKIMLESLEKCKKVRSKATDAAVQTCSELDDITRFELQTQLYDTEALVKRLRRENEDQRKEIANLRITDCGSSSDRYGARKISRSGSSSQNSYHSRGSAPDIRHEESTSKFPPLQTQSYWRFPRTGHNSYEQQSSQAPDYHNRKGRHHRQESRQDFQSDGSKDKSALPQVRNGSVRVDSSSYPPFFRSRGHHSNGFYNKETGNRKFRAGQKSQRDNNARQYPNYNDAISEQRQKDYDLSEQRQKDFSTLPSSLRTNNVGRDYRNVHRQ